MFVRRVYITTALPPDFSLDYTGTPLKTTHLCGLGDLEESGML